MQQHMEGSNMFFGNVLFGTGDVVVQVEAMVETRKKMHEARVDACEAMQLGVSVESEASEKSQGEMLSVA